MALDTRYIPVIFPQGLFRDKDTGLPLRNGVIYTWADESRTTPKPLFKISGTPPNYVYTALPNPLDLNSIGSFQDPNTNEDIAPYFFPYDSNEATANIQLYFYEVYSEGGKTSGVLQFTREGQPNLAAEAGPPEQQFENYIPNGQFLSHNDIPALPDGTKEVGEIRAPITVIAQGGWTFERPSGSSAKDFVTFDTFPDTYDNPRFAVRVKNESGGIGDTFKDLRIKFRDVNKFASNTQEYTFAFSATDNDGTGLPIELILIKNFGTGGDSPTERSIATFNIASSYPNPPANPYSAAFTFQLNTGKTIGDLNDDYLQLALRFPVASAFNASLTDFSLAQGAIVITGFPVQTNADTLTRSVAGWMPVPNPDGSDLYLPLKLTQEGILFDDSEIGDAISETQISIYDNSLHPTTNRMLADGNQYETLAYSPLGIPYARLQAKYWDPRFNIPTWGTGRKYFTGVIQGSGIELRITNNTGGAVTNAANGSISPGFSIITDHKGVSTYAVRSFYYKNNIFVFENTGIGVVTASSAGTSGFTVVNDIGGPETVWRVIVETVSAAALANGVSPGKYFTFQSNVPYYVWFKVDGTETDPAVPGHTAIPLTLAIDYDADLVANVVREALNGFQVTAVRAVAASSIPAGSFFTIDSTDGTNDIGYYVWYKKDGAGTDPAPSGRIGIQVDISTSDTAIQVNEKTQIAINMKYFASPDLRNAHLRGLGDASTVTYNPWITDWGPRLSVVPGIGGDNYGSYELDGFREHNHPGSILDLPTSTSLGAGGDPIVGPSAGSGIFDLTVAYQGSAESRGVNIAVNYVIKY